MKILVMFYSVYGHIFEMAKAVGVGIAQVPGTEAVLRKAPETLSDDILEKINALEPRKKWAHIPDVTNDDFAACECLIIGTPTRFGGACSQVRTFLDSTGGLFAQGTMIGKLGGAFTSSNTQHGGQETTLHTLFPYFFHHGMIVAGLPYDFTEQMQTDVVAGASPYGPATVSGPHDVKQPNSFELNGAKHFGKRLAEITLKLRK